MPTNQMNTGTDYSVQFYDGTSGVLVSLGDVQDVRIHAMKHDIKSAPFNGPPRFGYVPDGYAIEFTITRTGPVLEQFFQNLSQNFDNAQVATAGVLNESVVNPDGTISRYQFQNFVVFMPELGELSRDKVVTLRVEGRASTWAKIA